jgi:hypothetical protein
MRKTWRCFFCDDVFTRAEDAAEHFGGTLAATAGCQIKGSDRGLLGALREAQAQLHRYHNEDSEIMRCMRSMQSEHGEAVRRAEETGYGRAVADMLALACPDCIAKVHGDGDSVPAGLPHIKGKDE